MSKWEEMSNNNFSWKFCAENQQKYSDIQIDFELCEHGVEHSGPAGAQLAEMKTTLSKKEVIDWAKSKGCPRSCENKRRTSLFCLQG